MGGKPLSATQRRVDKLTREALAQAEASRALMVDLPSRWHPFARRAARREVEGLMASARRLVELAEQIPVRPR